LAATSSSNAISGSMPVICHFGYITDLIVLGATVYVSSQQSVASSSSVLRPCHVLALQFLRYWRLADAIVRVVAKVELSHESTRARLAASEATNAELRARFRLAEDRLDSDVQSRTEVEALCEEYKNEIDCLMAALQIAARDVAQSGGGGGYEDISEEMAELVGEFTDPKSAEKENEQPDTSARVEVALVKDGEKEIGADVKAVSDSATILA
jgi:hypothetical protein